MNGDGSEDWEGLLPFGELPSQESPPQGYLSNWNNKPVSWWNNGDNIPWASASDLWLSESVTDRVWRIMNLIEPLSEITFQDLKAVPKGRSTTRASLPPGQSAFRSRTGEPGRHVQDQWALHEAWQFKNMLFGSEPLPGDFNGDLEVSFSDFVLFTAQDGALDGRYHPEFDLVFDGAIDFNDFIAFIQLYGTRYCE